MKTKRGRKRQDFCAHGHPLTNETRRMKIYITTAGAEHLVSAGCRPCSSTKTRERYRKNADANCSERKPSDSARTRAADSDARMDRIALQMLGRGVTS
jgi:hypothetical protein